MKSSYKRIAIQLLDRYKACDDVEFVTDTWRAAHFDGWCVRAYWTDRDHPEIGRLDAVAIHTEDEMEADEVIKAIERHRSL